MILVGSAAATILQSADASRQLGRFVKSVAENEDAVMDAIDNPNIDLLQFVRELMQNYVNEVSSIFLVGPDTIPALVKSYAQDTISLFENPPPDDGKSHEQIKHFKQLTHVFQKGVLCGIVPCT